MISVAVAPTQLESAAQFLSAQQQVSVLRSASVAARARITALQQQVQVAAVRQLQKVQQENMLRVQQQHLLSGLMRNSPYQPPGLNHPSVATIFY